MMEADRDKRLQNQQRLRDLIRAHSDTMQVFCAHDATELQTMIRQRVFAPGVGDTPEHRVSA
jgi:hypothetical protein